MPTYGPRALHHRAAVDTARRQSNSGRATVLLGSGILLTTSKLLKHAQHICLQDKGAY